MSRVRDWEGCTNVRDLGGAEACLRAAGLDETRIAQLRARLR